MVRKHTGYSHIPQRYAAPINAFYQETFNPWLNLHRPCLFATEVVSDKGKIIKRYRLKDVKTPLAHLEKLSADGLVKFKKGVTLQALQTQAKAQTDLAAAQQMQKAKADLFELFSKTRARRQAWYRVHHIGVKHCTAHEIHTRRRGASGGLAGAYEKKTSTPIQSP